MYGPLPPTISGLALPFIYPPFAAMLLAPLRVRCRGRPPGCCCTRCRWAASRSRSTSSARQVWPDGGPGGAVRRVAALALPLLLWIEPVLETFEFGQVNLVLMALVAVDCLAPRTRWPRGLLVGIAAAIKLTPAAFVLFFLLRRDARAAARHGRHRRRRHRDRVRGRRGARPPATGSAARPPGSAARCSTRTRPSRPCSRAPRYRPWPRRRCGSGGGGAAGADRPGGAPRRAGPGVGDRRRVRAAGEPDVVVAPLGVDRAGAARGRRGGGPAALARLGGRRRGAGRDVLPRPVPLPAARAGPGAELDAPRSRWWGRRT